MPDHRALLIFSERFRDHRTPPGHPERIERADVMSVVVDHARAAGSTVVEPEPATEDQLKGVHTPRYVELIASTAGRAVQLDPDTFTSDDSFEVACLAAGAALQSVESVFSGPRTRSVALVRPPGHHAESGRAMGFCLFNNIAVAAAYARHLGAERVAIVDYDVHHGNGTQEIFYRDSRVLYASTHQYPFYPGTGAAGEVGEGAGRGFTVNVPLEAGATDADYALVFKTVLVPVLDAFQPDILLVSAGFDAHERDPLGGMRLTTEGYAALSKELCTVADRWCGGRIVFVTEGGYHLVALRECLVDLINLLDGAVPVPTEPQAPTRRARDAVEAVRRAQRPYWPGL